MELEIAGLGIWAFCLVVGAAFSAGFIDSIAGGGGLISLPAMLLAGIPPHLALGTGKIMGLFGTTVASYTYMRNNVILWPIVAAGIGFSLAGSFMGAKLILYIDPNIVGKLLVFLLPFAAIPVLIPLRVAAVSALANKRKIWCIAPPLCFLIGLYDGFYGPGSGTFFLLGLHFFLGLPLLNASATAKPFNWASNVGAAAVFILNGKVLYALALPMILANTLGSFIGTRMALTLGAQFVRSILIVSLLLLFGTLLIKYY